MFLRLFSIKNKNGILDKYQVLIILLWNKVNNWRLLNIKNKKNKNFWNNALLNQKLDKEVQKVNLYN